jgi:thiol-disulfide isomerase/thioredoxin
MMNARTLSYVLIPALLFTAGATAQAQLTAEDETRLSQLSEIGLQVVDQPIDAEDFELPLLTAEAQRSLASYEGSVVLLNFWASWCPPCIEEMPSMQALYDELGGDGFEIVAVNVQEDPETVQSFIDENGFDFPVLLDRTGQTAQKYAVRGLPTSYILDSDGRILARKVGFHEWDGADTIETFDSLSD